MPEDEKRDDSKTGREKYWSELTTDEKIERMRRQVKHIQSRCSNCTKELRTLDVLFHSHQHSQSGERLVPAGIKGQVDFDIDYGRKRNLSIASQNPDEVFF